MKTDESKMFHYWQKRTTNMSINYWHSNWNGHM